MKNTITKISIILIFLACVVHASDHAFNDSGYSGSAEQRQVDISTSLTNELEVKPGIAEALAEDSLELLEEDLGSHVGDEQRKGEIKPDPFLDNYSKRKIMWANYDCMEKVKHDGTWRRAWT